MPELREVFDTVTNGTEPDLDSWLQQENRHRKASKRRRVVVTATVIGLLMAIVALYTIPGRNESAPTSPSITPSNIPERWSAGDDAFVDVETGRPHALPESITSRNDPTDGYQVSPDGSMVAFHGYVAKIDGSDVSELIPGGFGARWSPDGTTLAYSLQDEVFVIDVATGERTLIATLHGVVGSPTFGADGDTLVLTKHGANAFDLWTVPIAGGSKTLLLRNAAYGAYSPDGTTFTYWHTGRWNDNKELYSVGSVVITDPPRDPRNPGSGGGSCGGFLCTVSITPTAPAWSPNGTRVVYADGMGAIHVLDAETGDDTVVGTTGDDTVAGTGGEVTWLDDDTLIVPNYSRRSGR